MTPNLLTPEERVLPTLNDDGTRRWLKPKHASGRFDTARKVVGYALIALFVALPFWKIDGRPSIWLDLPSREFTLFGKVFLATDTEVLLLGLLAIFIAIFLVTALLGRVWCGWGCPQTVYMELVYRPIERWTDRLASRKGHKRLATALKYGIFVLLSLGLAHTFLAYFVSVDELAKWVQESPLEHPGHFAVMAGTFGLILFDFAYFREQMCTVACPYARLQSALIDKHSLIIGYDHERGEARGKGAVKEMKRHLPLVERQFGDCIDCNACVAVCPTGIDIRDGLQLECIACAQCIDACDGVMEKLGAEKGLIRYSSQAVLDEGDSQKLVRARTVIYPVILAALVVGLFFAVGSHGSAEVKILRGTGAPFMVDRSGVVSNQLRVRIANRTSDQQAYHLEVSGPEGTELIAPVNPLTVDANKTESAIVFVRAPQSQFEGGDLEISVVVRDDAGYRDELPFRLLGPHQ